jgi:hypothetical protein
MTYDPDRDARAPADISPNRRPYERAGTGLSVALMLALMAAFVAVGFWFYATQGSTTVARVDLPATEGKTGGPAQQEPPLPNTPTPPTVPSPSPQ